MMAPNTYLTVISDEDVDQTHFLKESMDAFRPEEAAPGRDLQLETCGSETASSEACVRQW